MTTTPENPAAYIPVRLDPATLTWLTTVAAADHHGSISAAAAAILVQARRQAEQTMIDAGIPITGGWQQLYEQLAAHQHH